MSVNCTYIQSTTSRGPLTVTRCVFPESPAQYTGSWELISQFLNGPLHIYTHNGWDQRHNSTARIRYFNFVVLYIYIPNVGPFIISTTSTSTSTVSFQPPLGQKQITTWHRYRYRLTCNRILLGILRCAAWARLDRIGLG